MFARALFFLLSQAASADDETSSLLQLGKLKAAERRVAEKRSAQGPDGYGPPPGGYAPPYVVGGDESPQGLAGYGSPQEPGGYGSGSEETVPTTTTTTTEEAVEQEKPFEEVVASTCSNFFGECDDGDVVTIVDTDVGTNLCDSEGLPSPCTFIHWTGLDGETCFNPGPWPLDSCHHYRKVTYSHECTDTLKQMKFSEPMDRLIEAEGEFDAAGVLRECTDHVKKVELFCYGPATGEHDCDCFPDTVVFDEWEGSCRTETDGKGEFRVVHLDKTNCESVCALDSSCVAFGWSPAKQRCELHTESIAQTEVEEQGQICSIKEIKSEPEDDEDEAEELEDDEALEVEDEDEAEEAEPEDDEDETEELEDDEAEEAEDEDEAEEAEDNKPADEEPDVPRPCGPGSPLVKDDCSGWSSGKSREVGGTCYNGAFDLNQQTVSKTFSGLTAGCTYTLSAVIDTWASVDNEEMLFTVNGKWRKFQSRSHNKCDNHWKAHEAGLGAKLGSTGSGKHDWKDCYKKFKTTFIAAADGTANVKMFMAINQEITDEGWGWHNMQFKREICPCNDPEDEKPIEEEPEDEEPEDEETEFEKPDLTPHDDEMLKPCEPGSPLVKDDCSGWSSGKSREVGGTCYNGAFDLNQQTVSKKFSGLTAGCTYKLSAVIDTWASVDNEEMRFTVNGKSHKFQSRSHNTCDNGWKAHTAGLGAKLGSTGSGKHDWKDCYKNFETTFIAAADGTADVKMFMAINQEITDEGWGWHKMKLERKSCPCTPVEDILDDIEEIVEDNKDGEDIIEDLEADLGGPVSTNRRRCFGGRRRQRRRCIDVSVRRRGSNGHLLIGGGVGAVVGTAGGAAVGGVVGGGAGTAVGAAIGTVVGGPVIGTAIGAAVGGVAGGVVGTATGTAVGTASGVLVAHVIKERPLKKIRDKKPIEKILKKPIIKKIVQAPKKITKKVINLPKKIFKRPKKKTNGKKNGKKISKKNGKKISKPKKQTKRKGLFGGKRRRRLFR